jgi:hypothetical protein
LRSPVARVAAPIVKRPAAMPPQKMDDVIAAIKAELPRLRFMNVASQALSEAVLVLLAKHCA